MKQVVLHHKFKSPRLVYGQNVSANWVSHDDVIRWKHFLRYWPFVQGIHRLPVNSPYKGHWRGALMFSLISARTNNSGNNGDAGDLRRHRAHHDVIVMIMAIETLSPAWSGHQQPRYCLYFLRVNLGFDLMITCVITFVISMYVKLMAIWGSRA